MRFLQLLEILKCTKRNSLHTELCFPVSEILDVAGFFGQNAYLLLSLVERLYFPLHTHVQSQAYATITSWIHMLKLRCLLSSASVRAWSCESPPTSITSEI